MMLEAIYETQDFPEAIYLRKNAVPFLRVEWNDPKRATFVFKFPSDDILAAWVKGDDGGVRAILAAADFLRDALRGGR
jgi:hypothetical protein